MVLTVCQAPYKGFTSMLPLLVRVKSREKGPPVLEMVPLKHRDVQSFAHVARFLAERGFASMRLASGWEHEG